MCGGHTGGRAPRVYAAAAMTDSRPIGVFDSGVGGLTVLRELRRQAPAERLLYVADLAHFPYGPRAQPEVRELALGIIESLARLDTKLVVIACNTATAAALNVARETFDIPIVGVIAPGAQAAAASTHGGRVAVISTAGTLQSQEYVHAIKEANPGVTVLGIAAPELVDIVEAGRANSEMADDALRRVLAPVFEWRADTLVLGCTHYPLLHDSIQRVTEGRLRVIDSAATTAARVCRILDVNRLRAPRAQDGSVEVLVTASPDDFSRTAARIFGEPVPARPLPVARAPQLRVVSSQ